MKAKFFLILIILLGAAGSVFYFGWIQFQLSEHTYGVIFTKTSGWEKDPVHPGTFSWRWERLVPTNMTLYKVPVHRQNVRVSQEGSLPSSSTYSSVLESNENFEFAVDLSISYALKPSFLPKLVKEEKLTPEGLDRWYEGLNRQILSAATEIISEQFETTPAALSKTDISPDRLEELLITQLSEKFTYIDFHGVQPRSFEIPDIELYYAAKNYYLNVLEQRKEIEKETLEKKREWKVNEESKLEVLEKYGKLFTDYPGLVEYFSLKETDEFKDLLPSVDLIEGRGEKASSEPSKRGEETTETRE